jgi:putative cardiolipin synthase
LLPLAISLMAGCASLPENIVREETAKLDTTTSSLAQAFAQHATAHPGQSGAYPLGQGKEALAARVTLARRAELSLDVQYYIWHNDDSGRLMLKELLAAADRGVRVRILIDDLGVNAANDDVFRWLDAHPQVSVVLFNPIATRNSRKLGLISDPRRLNRRMHNKSMTADNTVTIVGGRNIGDEYFALNELVNFADMDVLAIGPVADQVVDSFDIYWNSTAAIPISAFHQSPASAEDLAQGRAALNAAVRQSSDTYDDVRRDVLSTSHLAELEAGKLNFYWAGITALYDSPDKAAADHDSELLLQQLGSLLGKAQSDLLIVSPYFVPGKAGTAGLVAAAQRGVRVQIVTNSLAATDVGAVHAGYKKWRRKLLEGGVKLYEMMPSASNAGSDGSKRSIMGSSGASLHAKLFVIDRQQVFIGSMNLDPRSVQINTEIGLLIDSAEMAGDLLQQIEGFLGLACYRVDLQAVHADQSQGKQQLVWIENSAGEQIRYTDEPKTTFWQRLSVAIISLFPIDSQL